MFGKIIGTGSYVPANVVTNDDLAQVVETNDEWIRERTGIKSRHIMSDETTTDMACKAAANAIAMAGIDPKELELIIVSTVSADVILPNTACMVQRALGAKNAMCFDVNTACTGFITAYNTAQSYIHAGIVSTALVIGAEGLSRIIDWTDRGSCILFGDGAGAAVIRRDETAVFETVMHADGEGGSALTLKSPFFNDLFEKQGYVQMDGGEIFKFAVREVPGCIQELMDKMGKTSDEIDYFLLHQANARILRSIAKKLKIDEGKLPMNIATKGNTSSACIPILLDELVRAGRLESGARIIMSGFGGGLTWASTYFIL